MGLWKLVIWTGPDQSSMENIARKPRKVKIPIQYVILVQVHLLVTSVFHSMSKSTQLAGKSLSFFLVLCMYPLSVPRL